MKNQTIYISGMHCKACEVLINDQAEELSGVISAKSSNASGTLVLKIKDTSNVKNILRKLNLKIKDMGYEASLEKFNERIDYKKLLIPFGLAAGIFAFFILLQKSGVLNLYSPNNISYFAVFIIGVIASLSSCMAVVGGLVMSLSSSIASAKKSGSVLPLTTFHVSRVVSFFVLGGLIGLAGSLFKITPTGNLIMTLLLFFVMFILGINLLDTFPKFKKLQLSLPNLGLLNNKSSSKNGVLAAIVLGALTFILPCGFTQSMQFYALSSGSFLTGALTMFIFSLGTLPVLAALSFVSVSFSQSKHSDMFFKTMGFLVIFFALINLISALTLAGLVPAILGF